MLENFIYRINKDSIYLNLLIKPQAKSNQIIGILDKRLKIAIAAAPVDGKANKELINFIAKLLKIKKSQIVITSGEASNLKQLQLPLQAQLTLENITKKP